MKKFHNWWVTWGYLGGGVLGALLLVIVLMAGVEGLYGRLVGMGLITIFLLVRGIKNMSARQKADDGN